MPLHRGFVLPDAFGNALGNSIVAGLSSTATPQQAERKAKAAAHKAVLSGASPQQALMLEKQTYAQELGGTVNPVSAADSDETIDTGRRTTSVDGNAGFWLSDGNDRAFIDYNSSFDAISGFLGNSAARDLGVKFAAQTIQGYQKSQQAFADGYDRGFVSSVRSGVRAQQQQQLQTARQLDAQSLQKWQADQARAKMTTMEKVQLGLDVAGMTEIPVVSQIAELGSAGISLYNGDYVGAGLGVVSMIPIAGKWAEVAKFERVSSQLSEGEKLRQKYAHMSKDERRTIINDRLETLAANRLVALESSISSAHFKGRHGAQTTLAQQYNRAVNGIDPVTQQLRFRRDGSLVTPNSSRFLSHRDQINAIDRATSIYQNTGSKVLAELPIKFKSQAGEGYYGGSGAYGTSFSIQVWFNKNAQPVTAFPILGQ